MTTNKRTLILQAMLNLIAERGLQDTPMSLVAEQAGVSVGAIYHHFSGKEALLEALYFMVKAKYGRSLLLFDQTQSWEEKLNQIWLNAYHFFVRHPKESRFLEQFESSLQYHTQLLDDDSMDDSFNQLLSFVQAEIDAGHIKPLPMEVLNDLTLGVAKLTASRQLTGLVTLDQHTLQLIANASLDAIRQQ